MVTVASGMWANSDWERARWEGEALMRKARGQDAWRPRYVIDCVVWPLLLFCLSAAVSLGRFGFSTNTEGKS
eukprot:s818_g24.t1